MIYIKTENEEFDAAQANGYVYGQVRLAKIFFVYVELGAEREYNPSPKDDPKTEYRFFVNCTLWFAESESQLDNGDYVATDSGNVVIYR
jgi:hypothetical protein